MSTNPPNFEIPPEMRAFAEKSVAQAKQALDGFISAARHATATAENSANNARSEAMNIAQLAMRFSENNIANSFDFAQRLLRAKDAQEVMTLHSDYVKQQMAVLTEQAKELGQKTAKMAGAKVG